MATDKTHPELPEDGKRLDLHTIYINHTTGVWLRTLEKTGDVELWYDGKFQCSWDKGVDPVELARAVGRECIALGERKKLAEIQVVFGIK